MPAITKVDICNRALQILGAKSISALTDSTVQARACNLAYDIVRRSELRKRVWSFAIERESLAADSPAPTWGRQNSFTVPSNFLRLAEGYPEQYYGDGNTVGVTVASTSTITGYRDWVIEKNKIVTNDSAPLQIRFVYDVTDTTLFDSTFSEALAAALGYELCEALTQSNSKKADCAAAYKTKIEEAKQANSIEVAPADPPPDPWLTCRN